MSRRKRNVPRGTAIVPSGDVALPTITVPSSMFGVSGTGYQGAQWSPNRGYIYWPTLDPKRELNQLTRRELARKIHFLCANVGLPNRLITGIRNMVIGTGLVPRAITRDRVFNLAATKYFENRASSALSYDVTAKFSGWEMQRQAYDTRLKDGDAAIVYTKSEAGRTLRKLYSGLSIGNGNDQRLAQDKWIDGVFLDALERPALYRFLNDQGQRSRDIAAQDMVFLGRYPAPGSIRGEPILKHAANKLTDIVEVHSSWMQQIKNSAMIGYYIAAAQTQTSAQSMPNEVLKQLYASQAKQVETSDGRKVTLKLVMGNGNEIAELPPGYDIKTLLDQRPHPNQKELLEEFIRDISWGAGMSSDLLWNIYKLGGANTRFVLSDAQTFVEVEQDSIVYGWLMRDYVQEIADGLATGALPPCEDPEWWAHGWVPPARQTVDFGRDGRIFLEEYNRGLITTERYFALKGQDAREEFIAECDFAEFRRAEMKRRNLTEADFAYQRSAAAVASAAAPEPAPTDDQENPEQDPNPAKKEKTDEPSDA